MIKRKGIITMLNYTRSSNLSPKLQKPDHEDKRELTLKNYLISELQI